MTRACIDCGRPTGDPSLTRPPFRCPGCRRARHKAQSHADYLAHRDAYIARAERSRLAHPNKGVDKHLKKREKNPQLYRDLYRSGALRRAYGITPEDYRDMLVGQAGRCLICLLVPAKDLVVDHDHSTGQVRGLLCLQCNAALGMLEDRPDRLRSAAAYLERNA